VYGKDDAATIIDCCQLKMAFPPKSQEDAELLSKEIGFITEKTRSESHNIGFLTGNAGSTSTSVAQRALLLPQEIKALGQDAIILLNEGMPPAIGKKILYYKHPVFKKRCAMPPHPAPILDYHAVLQQSASTAPASPPDPASSPAPDAGAVPQFGTVPSFGAAPASAPETLNAFPATGGGAPDIFSVAMSKNMATENENVVAEVTEEEFSDAENIDLDEMFTDSPQMDGVFGPVTDAELEAAMQTHYADIEAATEEKMPLLVPETYKDYEISLEEIFAMTTTDGATKKLDVYKKADLSDLMQNFSDVEIPEAQADFDLASSVSGFFASFQIAEQAEAA
jgi:hypothetical protein